MSGIAAILRLDGGPAAADALAPALAELAARGPDGEAVFAEAPVALGHRMLATTPEALAEPMPLADPRTGCVLTADVRLDNRDELLAALGIDAAGRTVGDGALILHAWDRWGDACVEHLLGDFAFALWDPRRRLIFAARDQMGMRQLIYTHRPGARFACTSSARATARVAGRAPRLNDLRLAEALIGHEVGDLTSTCYADVHRLPPGHCLTVSENGFDCRAYWRLEPVEPLRLGSDAAYAEALAEVLAEAVRCRLRSAGPVGAMLSGGMDSGAVAALAAPILATEGRGALPTFSVTGPDPAVCVESRAIRAALGMDNLEPTLIDHSRLGALAARSIPLWHAIEEPFDLHMSVPRLAYLAARGRGIRVVLDGGAGDAVLSEADRMARLLRAGRWRAAWRDALAQRDFYGPHAVSVGAEIYHAARAAFVPDWLRAARRNLQRRRPVAVPADSVIDLVFARSSGLIERLEAQRSVPPPPRRSFAETRVSALLGAGLFVGRERYDRVAAAIGVEPRDPFLDLRVIRLCLGLPMDQLLAGGWPKIVLRRAMAGRLPEAVIWRRGQEHLGWAASRALLAGWNDWRVPILDRRTDLATLVKPAVLTPDALAFPGPHDTTPAVEHVLPMALFLGNALAGCGR